MATLAKSRAQVLRLIATLVILLESRSDPYGESNARGDGRLQGLRPADADRYQSADQADLRRLQGPAATRAQPQGHCPPQGQASGQAADGPRRLVPTPTH